MFVRRACSEILPTFSNQRTRKIINENLCPIYRLLPKTVGHALWDCEATKNVWSQSMRTVQKMAIISKSILEIWQFLISKLSRDELTEVAFIARQIQFRRNQLIHQSLFIHPNAVLASAIKEYSLYKQTCNPLLPVFSDMVQSSSLFANRNGPGPCQESSNLIAMQHLIPAIVKWERELSLVMKQGQLLVLIEQ